MKDLLFSLCFLLLLVLAGTEVLSAQVTAQRLTHSRGNNDALILELPSAQDKLVGKLWTDWLKENYDVRTKKVKKTKDELESLNFSIPGVSAGGKVDMYSAVRSSGTGSEVTIWIATPEGYVSPELNSTRYVEAEKMLMRFALEVSRAQIELDVANEEAKLQELEKELDKLRKEQEKYEKAILDAEKAIEDARLAIERSRTDQENKSREIGQQIQQVEMVKRKLKDF
ncbi:hypothetical protein QWY85_19105 [Neolewinella lacunae]|uniref:Uncharacterized protein n=1 Tax=Neolewinella lacunae TaxID=1517758 RepID=A0A923PLE6_9BACT|nr:hypothetical protein [Neolewinella lacunae]MBC6994866.1 hypothetical protein [Neolewinella lacunae]MDN3636786.1 hypothetical protein [Neolewinella lacunae]